MESIIVGIKRFFMNKNTVTIIGIIACLGILYWAYNYRIKKTTDPISIPYAIQTIGPKTLITADMVKTKKVPGGIVNENVIRTSNEIIGKYVINTAVIPEGSMFYKSQVVDWDEMPTSIAEDIPDGNTIVALPVNMDTTYGNSIYPGNYIDLYFVTNKVTDEKYGESLLMLGKFIESIRVLAVTDSSNRNVFETAGDPLTPAYLIFSVPEDMHLLLRKASYLDGTIFPVPRNAEYSANPKQTRIASSYIQNHILEQTVDVSGQDKKFISDNGAEIIGGE